jgi:NAD-dependent deacetylase
MNKKEIVVLTGAGISAESGISTFRDSDGLWKTHRFEDVANPLAWRRDPELVLEFYNVRRKQLFEVNPNAGHIALVQLEQKYNVNIITQNVDDLHERAGSVRVLHLHGELKKARSTVDPSLVYELKHWELKTGDTCEKGSQLRPHIVWFGEDVPEFPTAVNITRKADILIVIGTSLNVYPAAGLIHYAEPDCRKYLIDPKADNSSHFTGLTVIRKTAGEGVPELVARLLEE